MAFKHKFTYEEKVKIVSEYIDGTYGFREICKRYDINQGSLKDWKRLYETFGLYRQWSNGRVLGNFKARNVLQEEIS